MARPDEPVELDEAAEDTPPRKSKKKLFIVIGALVVLLGGGTGVWLLIPSGDHSASAKAEAEKAPDPSLAPIFVPLETFTVNLQGGEQYLQTDITLQMHDQEEVDALKVYMPLIRSRLLAMLSSKHAENLVTPDDKKQLAQEILAQVKQPFQPKGKPQKVDDVLFTSFVIQ